MTTTSSIKKYIMRPEFSEREARIFFIWSMIDFASALITFAFIVGLYVAIVVF